MTSQSVETSVIAWGDRYTPASAFADQIHMLAASEAVDMITLTDQMNSFVPDVLWNSDNAPMAALIPDTDSCADAQTIMAYAAALAPEMKFAIMMDAIRRGPAELTQSTLTMANLTQGRVVYEIGGGEMSNCKPYGWKRYHGLKKMEDFFRVFHAFWDAESHIDFEGHLTSFQNSSLGGAKIHKPKLWGLGGGPKLLDLATSYCDGVSIATPMVWTSPEQAAEHIAEIRQQVKEKGRDPDAFTIALATTVLLHEDEAVIDQALDNPIIRYLSAAVGRAHPDDWAKEGLVSPWPEGWSYYLKLIPFNETAASVKAVLDRTTRQLAERSFYSGSPEKVAADIQPYIDAGVDSVVLVDFTPLILTPEDASGALRRNIDVCAALKGI